MRALLESIFWWASPLLGLFISYAGLRYVLASPHLLQFATDLPNGRSLHSAPTPRVGGVVMMVALTACWLAFVPELRVVAVLAVGLTLLSALDDRRGLPIMVRFGGHALAAAVASLQLLGTESPAQLAAAFLATVWATNLYNFMDGADGLAGGMAAIGFGFLGLAAHTSADPHLAALAWTISAVALAFLRFNFPPARVFMGDAGSIPLGFLASILGIAGMVRGHWPFWFPALVFAPFLLDATYTLLRRAAQGERIWLAHRSHCYQVLVLSGWSHKRLALAEYGLMLTCGSLGMLAMRGDSHRAALIWMSVIFVTIWLAAVCEKVRRRL